MKGAGGRCRRRARRGRRVYRAALSADSPIRARRRGDRMMAACTALLAKPMNGINAPQRPDCVAGHVGLEVRRETGKE